LLFPMLAAVTAHANTTMITVAAYTPRGKEIYREVSHVELARDYERTFAWKKAAYELSFDFGPDPAAPPVGLLVIEHPHVLAKRPYVVTLQVAPFDGTLDPGDVTEFDLASGALHFKVWYAEEGE